MNSPIHAKQDTAFTLIELLVVISIIALLVGILLPALGSARKSAQILASSSNQRQIAISMLTYATDNKDRWMLWQRSVNGNTGDGMTNTPIKWIWSSQLLLLNYLGTFDIYVDPSFGAPTPFLDIKVTSNPADAADLRLRTLHYGYNYVFLGSNYGVTERGYTNRPGSPVVPPAMPPTVDEIKTPTNTLVTTLTRASTGYNDPNAGGAHVVLDSPRNVGNAGLPDPRHNGSAQTSWADGHVSQVVVPNANQQFQANLTAAIDIAYTREAFGRADNFNNGKYLGTPFSTGNFFDLHSSNPGD